MLKSVPAIVTVVLAIASPVFCQDARPGIDPEKVEVIRHLLEVSGQSQLMKQGVLAMVDQMRPVLPDVPDEFFDEFKKAALSDELTELLIPVFDRHYSLDDIRELIFFYESPIGRKLVQQQPLVQQDSMAVGNAWGQRKGAEIMQNLKDRGIINPQKSSEN